MGAHVGRPGGHGGSRIGAGKPPETEWVLLRREVSKTAPEWPLTPAATPREAQVWERLWKKPQAHMWHVLDLADNVALYVRRFVEAEQHDVKAAHMTLVKSMADGLGISAHGLRSLRWKIADEKTTTRPASVTPLRARNRLTVKEES